MKRNRDPLALTPHWHLDCRIEVDLPEDNIVGTRFLINAALAAAALAALLFTGWLGYLSLSLTHQIGDWEQRIKDNRAEVLDVQRMQREYATEAAKIDQAYALLRPQYHVSGLIAELGRTRPASVVVDIVEWNDAGIVLRGHLRENAEQATKTLADYQKALSRDEKIGPLFREIVLTDLDRGTIAGEALKFEIAFRPKPAKS
jgi:hypothetical protein